MVVGTGMPILGFIWFRINGLGLVGGVGWVMRVHVSVQRRLKKQISGGNDRKKSKGKGVSRKGR